MIKNGNLQSSANISTKDKTEVSNILSYFKNSHSLKDVKYLPKDFKLDDMNNVMGFPYENSNYGSNDKYFNFMRDQSDKTIDIKGYDYLVDMRNINNTSTHPTTGLDISYNYELATIKINYGKKEVYSNNLNAFVKTLTDKYGTVSKADSIPSKEMIFIEENQKIKIKFIFLNISGNKNQTSQTIAANGMDFYLLIKIK